MAEKLIDLRSLGPNIGDWSTKVQVLTKMNPRLGNNSRTTYQKVLLCDAMGDCAEAVIYNSDVELFQHSLKIGRMYKISNATVSLINEKFKNQLTTCKYQLTISARTSVLDIDSDGTMFVPPCPELLDRTQFVKEIGRGTKISTVCVIIAKRLPRRMFLKERENLLYEYAAIDQNLKPFVISVWQDTVPPQILDVLNLTQKLPVFVLMNFTVTDFYGVCLSSTSQSVLHHNYDHSSFHDMLTWRNANNEAIMSLVKEGGLFEEQIVDDSAELLSIKQVLDINKEGKYNILVKGKLTNTKQKFYYMCCETCNYGTTGVYNSNFTCRSCAITSVAKPRFRCSINIYDDSGDLDVVLFGNDVEQILGLFVIDVYETYCEGKEIPAEVINARMDGLWFRMKIRGYPSQIKTAQALSYNVVYIKCYEGDYEECKKLAADKDPESSAYDVSKKETDAVIKFTPADSPIEQSNASIMEDVETDKQQKIRRLVRKSKRVVMSDDDIVETESNPNFKPRGNAMELHGAATTVDKEKLMNYVEPTEPTLAGTTVDKQDLMISAEPTEPTLAALFKLKKNDATQKTSVMGKGIGVAKETKGKSPKKVKMEKGNISPLKEKRKSQWESAKKENKDENEDVKRSTRGRIIKPKNLD